MPTKYRRLCGAMPPLTLLLLLLAVVAPVVALQSESTLSPSKEYLFTEFINFGHPFFLVTDLAFTPDGRILVSERAGRIKLVHADGTLSPQPFLDLSAKVASTAGEEGLVSVVLHPSFAQNGYFYVNYTDLSHNSKVERYQVSGGDLDQADPASAHLILEAPQPAPIHNGSELVFGPDGYLYIGFGDGGPHGDPDNNGQDGQSLLGAILRVDVDNPDPGRAYSIPADNPFAGDQDVLDEIWAMGLRNPWRFSFDRLTGDLYIGDVGSTRFEEINYEPAPSAGGFNYGWRCYEGQVEAIPDGCLDRDAYQFPILTLAHRDDRPGASVCAIVGGIVHRGDAQSPLYGRYLYADYCTGQVWIVEKDQSGLWQEVGTAYTPLGYVTSFGQDAAGELYVADLGNIYRIRARSVTASPRAHIPLVAGP